MYGMVATIPVSATRPIPLRIVIGLFVTQWPTIVPSTPKHRIAGTVRRAP